MSTTTLPIPRARARWQNDALCAQTDPEAFFPEPGQNATPALTVCRRCPVRQDCLATAVAHREPHGVWGGLARRDRRQLYRPQAEHETERLFAGGAQ